MTGIYLSLGSNIEERTEHITRAIAALAGHGVRVVKRSVLYETEPVEFLAQDWFLNCVVEVKTELSPVELMRALLEIERGMGRDRVLPKGPRIIDMDILLYGSRVVRQANLEIPHPRMAQRRFVLVPLAEIASDVEHPVLKKSIAELLVETNDRSEVRPWRS